VICLESCEWFKMHHYESLTDRVRTVLLILLYIKSDLSAMCISPLQGP
jgi:hypothetical protein